MALEESYIEGSSAEMYCIVSNGASDKDLKYSWFNNGHELDNNYGEQLTIKFDQGHSRLKITNITVGNAGNYTCRVKNSYGQDSVSASLMVVGTFPSIWYISV